MEEVSIFVDFANLFHPTIKFTCEMSSERADIPYSFYFRSRYSLFIIPLPPPTIERFQRTSPSISWNSRFTNPLKAHWNLSVYSLFILPPFQYEKGLHQRKSITSFKNLLLLNSTSFKHKRDFEERLCNRSYPPTLVHKILTEVKFSDRIEAFRSKTKAKEILPFVTT